MTTVANPRVKAVLRRAAVRATRAPSVHNTQPWRMHIAHDQLSLFADRSRQLHVLDPTSRQMTISCGCALLNARVAIAADGMRADIERFPEPSQPDLLARINIVDALEEDVAAFAVLDNVIELRQTNRRHFSDDEVPAQIIDSLELAARNEGAALFVVRHEDHRLAVARLSQKADAIEHLNPAYRAELRAWTSDDPRRVDGVQALAVPHVDGNAHDEVPIRDFDTHGMGWLPSRTASSHSQCLVLICTAGDAPADWLRAGEALERVLLEITRHGFVASPLTQVTEVPTTRAELRRELGMTMNPHVLLRIGRAPLTPETQRRAFVDVLTEEA
jgi:nitroreductase